MSNVLFLTLFIPFITGIAVLFIPKEDTQLIRDVSLVGALLPLIGSLFIWFKFNYLTSYFQFSFSSSSYVLQNMYLQFILGVDGFSLIFLLLTTFIIPLCLWSSFNKKIVYFNLYISFFLFLEFAVLGSFISLDLLLFFIFFEIILIPMIFLIGV
jgi:NADH-quinone oxidoreductase subunit M